MKIAVAMSGGVDSSVSAALLKQQGHEVFGITMRQYDAQKAGYGRQGGIEADIKDAKAVCDTLGINHFVIDLQKDFEAIVKKNFIEEYASGRTPNPCVICNPTIKFGKFLDAALKLGAHKMATGHYIQLKEINGKFQIFISQDTSRDQTYMVWRLNQKQLSKTLFPIYKYKKSKLRQIAAELKLPIHDKKDSQEICFIKDHYEEYLKKHLTFQPGDIVLPNGNIIGKHRGLPLYTIGQRKGLNTPWKCPLYVKKLDVKNNRLIVTEDPGALLADILSLENINWISGNKPKNISNLQIQIRYNSNPVPIKSIQEKEKYLIVKLKNKTRAITPGQSGVIYNGDQLLGGGIIQ